MLGDDRFLSRGVCHEGHKGKGGAEQKRACRRCLAVITRQGDRWCWRAEISKAAGLTHGALYAQFPSKDALAAEALSAGLDHSLNAITKSAQTSSDPLTAYLDFLISPRQRDNLATGCPMTTSASEISRQDGSVCASFIAGFEAMAGEIEAVLGVVYNRRNGSSASAADYGGANRHCRGRTRCL